MCNTSGEPAGARAVVHARTTCKTAPTWRTSVPSVLRSATATTVNHIMSCISSVKESPRPRISDRGPHTRHGAECSHGRGQRSRTRSQAALRAVPSCLLLVVADQCPRFFCTSQLMKKRKSLLGHPAPSPQTQCTPNNHRKLRTQMERTARTTHAPQARSVTRSTHCQQALTTARPPPVVTARPRCTRISRISEVYTHATEPSAVMISVSARAFKISSLLPS